VIRMIKEILLPIALKDMLDICFCITASTGKPRGQPIGKNSDDPKI